MSPALWPIVAGCASALALGFGAWRILRGRPGPSGRGLGWALALLALASLLLEVRWIQSSMEARGCARELRRLAAALELFRENQDRLPDRLEELVPTYFLELPRCPAAEARGLDGSYQRGYSASQDRFTLVCRPELHPSLSGSLYGSPSGEDGVGGAPRYTSELGSAPEP